jgi:CheY-specific phosphatase CheX
MMHDTSIWLNATAESMAEICRTTLAMDLRRNVDTPKLPANLTGCYVALVGKEESLQIGLASDAQGCQILAQTLFGADNELSDTDVNDALGELANILAGGVKTRMAATFGGISLSLPIVMEGHLRVTDRQQVGQLDVALNDVPIRLLVVCSRDEAPEGHT